MGRRTIILKYLIENKENARIDRFLFNSKTWYYIELSIGYGTIVSIYNRTFFVKYKILKIDNNTEEYINLISFKRKLKTILPNFTFSYFKCLILKACKDYFACNPKVHGFDVFCIYTKTYIQEIFCFVEFKDTYSTITEVLSDSYNIIYKQWIKLIS